MKLNKKGQVEGSVGAVIQLVIGIAVAVMTLIMIGALGGQSFNIVEPTLDKVGLTSTVTGDTFTALNSTNVSLDNTQIRDSTLAIYNGTNLLTNNTDYIAYLTAGKIYLKNSLHNNTVLTANYQYNDPTIRDSVKGGIISSFSALKQTGDYLPIIVLAIIITIVLGLILGMSGGVMKGGGNTAL